MQFYEYKGYIICPAPCLIVESGYWNIELTIRHNNVIDKFSKDCICFTKGEAIFQSICYGKKLIDDGMVLRSKAV
jgi:hypothetical protein